ncbi:baseplate protein [Pantoea sp. YU22]|uniref:phage baseplate assembly protein n=1 Tax=Pantoea sp. YU22 TaxID=2497684 RepID=UPI000F89CD7B|nr:baseplate protein [Pantoea sp. YU22]RTY53635.1 baseplate protein [Pantoea sp. YU22]
MNDSIWLRINGREWGGWTSSRISAGIDRMARDFNVGITQRWPGDEKQGGATRVKWGDKVEVLIGDELVITGWVEGTPLRYDARNITRAIVGRSLTCDLVDCSAEGSQIKGKSLFQIAESLAKPFGIKVIDQGAPTGSLIDVQPEHGEAVVETLNRLLGQKQALAYDDAQGRLVIGGIGATRAATALVLGENILSCDAEKDYRNRFSVYQVAGQRAGNDQDFGEATLSAIKQSSSDGEVQRFRPVYIQQSGNATLETCKERCEFEARQRAAKSKETTYTVQGWRQGNGQLWKPNERVIVFDPYAGFDNEELVIAEVTYNQDAQGTTAELRVGPPDAYLPEPKAAKKKKKVASNDW